MNARDLLLGYQCEARPVSSTSTVAVFLAAFQDVAEGEDTATMFFYQATFWPFRKTSCTTIVCRFTLCVVRL